MANHCIDIICLNCGACWCERGCGLYFGANAKILQDFLNEKRKWEIHWDKPKDSGIVKTDDICSSCGSKECAIW